MNRPHFKWFPFAVLIAAATLLEVDTGWAQEEKAYRPVEEFTSGVQSNAATQMVVRKHRSSIMSFYKHQLKYHPGMQGSIKIRLIVKEDGHVRKIEVLADTVHNRALTSYIKKRAESWDFGHLENGQIVDLTFPFAPA